MPPTIPAFKAEPAASRSKHGSSAKARHNGIVGVLLVAKGNEAAVKRREQAAPDCERATQPPSIGFDRFNSPGKTLSPWSIASSLERVEDSSANRSKGEGTAKIIDDSVGARFTFM